jgi:predicted enzyme related to lactoylglutathione lyase
MPHPVIHAEIRSTDPDATREFFGKLFGWTYSDGAFPGYTFVDRCRRSSRHGDRSAARRR